MSKTAHLRAIVHLVAILTLLPAAVWSQEGRPPIGPAGPLISDLDLANRLYEVGLKNTEYLATLELSLKSSGDLWSVMKRSSPQGLVVTLEVNGKQVKDISKNDKFKVAEKISPGPLRIKARFVRPGKRIEERCYGELGVGFQQVIFLPFGGKEGYFSCVIAPRILPDDVFEPWETGISAEKKQAYNECASVQHRGSAEFWRCIDVAGIPLPDVPVG